MANAHEETEVLVMINVNKDVSIVQGLSYDISSTGTYMKTWKSGYGINGESYYLMMQNTTYGPPVTVSGTFTP